MNIELSKSQILVILDSLLKSHLDSKTSHLSSTDSSTEGLIPPKEFQQIYNKILLEAQENGMCNSLDTIGTTLN